MEKTGLTLEYILTQDMLWRAHEEDPHIYLFRASSALWQAIHKQELDNLDMRLFSVLERLATHSGWGDTGRNLKRTVSLWRESYTQLPPCIGSFPQYIGFVS